MATLVEYAFFLNMNSDLHQISIENANQMIKDYQALQNAEDNPILNAPTGSTGGIFGKNALLALLAQNNCIGMRYYFAVAKDDNDEDYITLVLVGVDNTFKDMVYDSNANEARIMEMALPCPNMCADQNDLNTSE